ncbi:CARDB domain-containing protein [Paractinoplanes durhamensis]|uniref:DUF11 domain-containing protein n=1 Tax=Paractinoplanes durhamensis TaxID=113563 RepID=A0ABQ3YVX3_9ACTN|nr:CARDB domain-containing protein [Actinoplanes durhamensis]GIE01703.1 hypothetical protein Adu01nite_30530 [Actinoplanes durhamensis]
MPNTYAPTPGGPRLPLAAVMLLLAGMISVALPASPAAAAVVTRTLAYFVGLANDQPRVKVVDTATDAVVDTIALPANALDVAVAPGGRSAYVVSHISDAVFKIDTATNAVVKTIPVGSSPRQIAFTKSGAKAYVTNGSGGTVSVIDTATDTVSRTITVGNLPYGVLAVPNDRLYVANNSGDEMTVIDTVTDTVSGTIPVRNAVRMGITPDGSRVYVTSPNSTSVRMINTSTMSEEGAVEAGPGPLAVVVTRDGTRAYVSHNTDQISVIDTATDAVTSIPAAYAIDADITPDGRRIYFAMTGTAAVLDTATNKLDKFSIGLDYSQAVAIATVTAPSADLIVTTTSSADPVEVGTTYTYSAAVTDNSADPAAGVKATLTFAGDARTIHSVSVGQGSCTAPAPVITCDLGSLAGGKTATITVMVKPQAAGSISVTAVVSADTDDPIAKNNTSTTSTRITAAPLPPPAADLSVVTTDSADPVALAGTFVSTSKVTNKGLSPATAVTAAVTLTGSAALVLDAAGSQGTCSIAGSVVTCDVGNLAKDATATITLTVEPQATGVITATAKTAGSPADPVPANNTAAQPTTVNNAFGCTIVGTAGNNILLGSAGNDVICLLGGNDTVNSFRGNDVIHGGSGNDRVQADTGNDTLYGGPGNDILSGGPGFDRIDGGPGRDICTAGEIKVNCP